MTVEGENMQKPLPRPTCNFCSVQMGISEECVRVHKKIFHLLCFKKHVLSGQKKKQLYIEEQNDTQGR